ncbi:TRAP transporter large permease [Spiribacter halobius]|uniref:TRAP transporter large permease protein n=1 Tax=Sediminicurvatus halobius TaxID=2182432 RepID=A0A2U2N1D4_9GAMM|nr:TRAP transporter large permease subunit [Spiribacter halobius]PWG62930.1 C4-dicarboxylate ABC transporter permease [Spiribacter halobius]UEX77441.1 TRAP transporter large permease subunit [Spiribacter halobius]
MSAVAMGLILAAVLIALLASGIWVAVALFAVGLFAMEAFTTSPTGLALGTSLWGAIASWSLAPLPLFVWMGEILFRSRLSEDMYAGLAPWLGRLPGRLLHVNVLGCGVFAAVSGSSAATAATIGRMSIPQLRERGYPDRMIIGTLAGSGTLGLLIPPSIILIVYGISAELSIARLFIAGILPGLMLVGLFMGYVALWALLHPGRMPPAEPRLPLGERLWHARRLIPVLALVVGVIGSIYVGVATPTEAAALGVAGALLLSAGTRSLTWASFRDGLMGATRTSCMIVFILAGAAFLTTAMGYTGVPRLLAEWIAALDLSPLALLAALAVFFIVMGCFLDGISVVVLTTSVVLPMVQAAGIDLLWFGIFLVVIVEMAQITPPVGFNLFVLQGLAGRNIFQIAWASLPFFLVLLLAVVILVVFPELATWLPDRMGGR